MSVTRHPARASSRRSGSGRRPGPGRRPEPVRRRGRRRRGYGLVVVGVAVLAVLAVAIAPLFQRAIRDLTLPLSYASIIRQQAAAKHLDPAFVAAVIDAETGFDARTSPTGAEGLMQIEPSTAEFLAHRSGGTTFTVADLGEPAVNIAYGSYYLRYLLDEFGGDETAAVAAYNGGETNVFGWIAAARRAGHAFTTADIPFPQTRAYVEKVERLQRSYRTKYAAELGES